jgi:hypothetical protein
VLAMLAIAVIAIGLLVVLSPRCRSALALLERL